MKNRMKIFGLGLMLSVLFGTMLSYASDRYKAIPSVRITVDTGSLSLGDDLSDDAGSYVSVPDSDYYELDGAEWIDSVRSLKVGDTPRMRVYLYSKDKTLTSNPNYDTIYNFKGTYSSSNVHVTGGEYISCTKRDSSSTLEVVIRIKPVKGTYESPEDAYWGSSRGVARWSAPENSSNYYDVICYRGSTVVKKLDNYHGTNYNFYPYMTKAGEYSFKVRTVPPESISSTVGKRSDWTESDSLWIEEDQVSDGSGQSAADANGNPIGGGNLYPEGTGNANVAGWIQQGDTWFFRYPNGELVRDGWLQLDGKYYMFDASGRMLTGWNQNKHGIWFFMDRTSGAMRTGWLQDGGKWYYLNTTKDEWEGCMIRGWMTLRDRKYYFNESGVMVTGWYQVDGKWYYFYPEGSTGGAYGYMARNTDIGSFHINEDGVWE